MTLNPIIIVRPAVALRDDHPDLGILGAYRAELSKELEPDEWARAARDAFDVDFSIDVPGDFRITLHDEVTGTELVASDAAEHVALDRLCRAIEPLDESALPPWAGVLLANGAAFYPASDRLAADAGRPGPAWGAPQRVLPPAPSHDNGRRSAAADAAVRAYHATSGADEPVDAALAGLLCALQHLCDRQGVEFEHALLQARSQYMAETREEGAAEGAFAQACEHAGRAAGFVGLLPAWIIHRDHLGMPGARHYASWKECCSQNRLLLPGRGSA